MTKQVNGMEQEGYIEFTKVHAFFLVCSILTYIGDIILGEKIGFFFFHPHLLDFHFFFCRHCSCGDLPAKRLLLVLPHHRHPDPVPIAGRPSVLSTMAPARRTHVKVILDHTRRTPGSRSEVIYRSSVKKIRAPMNY